VNEHIEINWREVETDPPSRGTFVELAKPSKADRDRFGLNDSEKIAVERLYWTGASVARDMFWRVVTPENFLSAASVTTDHPPIDEDDWLVVLLEPQQEIPTTYRIHEDSKELFVPIIRRRVPTGRTGKNGHKKTRIIPKPMFPGYGLIRYSAYGDDINKLLAVRGVRQVMRDQGAPVVLCHEAVLAIFRKQSQKHHEFARASVGRRAAFKQNTKVRIEAEGNVYDGQLATIEKDSGGSRIKVFLGMAKIRHTLPAEMVVAA
jgi:transcription antitermination factor NusG